MPHRTKKILNRHSILLLAWLSTVIVAILLTGQFFRKTVVAQEQPRIQVRMLRYAEHYLKPQGPTLNEMAEKIQYVSLDGLKIREEGHIICPNALLPRSSIIDLAKKEVIYLDSQKKVATIRSLPLQMLERRKGLQAFAANPAGEKLTYRGYPAVKVFQDAESYIIVHSQDFELLAMRRLARPKDLLVEMQIIEYVPDFKAPASIFEIPRDFQVKRIN